MTSGVAAYIRVSTEQQKEEGSHDNQRDRIQQWVDRSDYDGVEFFEDIAISGQSDSRPSFDEMMSRREEFDAVVVRELSRFGRSLQPLLQDIEKLDASDVEFITLSEEFDTSSAQGKLLLQVKGAFDEFWANLARERALEMVQRRREQGKPIGRPKKLDDEYLTDVYDLRRKGVSYAAIARVIEAKPNAVDEISRETIRRYCDDADVEPEEA